MRRLILLDAGPLGIVTKRRGVPDAEACRTWVAHCLRQGALVFVPAVAYYEVRRELERMHNTTGLARLEAFCSAVPDRYLLLSDTALRLGCRLWAQALTLDVQGADRIIATTNVGHLARFEAADLWTH